MLQDYHYLHLKKNAFCQVQKKLDVVRNAIVEKKHHWNKSSSPRVVTLHRCLNEGYQLLLLYGFTYHTENDRKNNGRQKFQCSNDSKKKRKGKKS